jgi:hypothetical protein
MALAFVAGVAIGLILLLLAGIRLWTARLRHRKGAPVTEADARAHALPLTKSILSVGPRAPDRNDADI